MSREQILQRVAYASEVNPQRAAISAYMDIILGHDDLLELYKQNQSANKAEVIESSVASLQDDVLGLLERINPARLLYAKELPICLESLQKATCYELAREDMGDSVFGSDCALLEANLGVANLGIINHISSAKSPRLLSLTTDKVIFLLKKERVVRNIADALAQIKKEHSVLPTNILFIAGPSRTADIEFQVVFGVHGPREVFVVLY